MVRRAILLRPVMVLDAVPETDLTGTQVLVVLGENDAFRQAGERLADALAQSGAEVSIRILGGRHELGPEDAPAITNWLNHAALGPT